MSKFFLAVMIIVLVLLQHMWWHLNLPSCWCNTLWCVYCYSKGDVALLNCTAIVNTSNETLTDKNPISDSIHRIAGPELRNELYKLKGRGRYWVGKQKMSNNTAKQEFWSFPFSYNRSFVMDLAQYETHGFYILIGLCGCFFTGCRTGEAKLTEGFNLAARFVIHTVGPKYKAKYRTAAESSLYSCYRNVMQLAK